MNIFFIISIILAAAVAAEAWFLLDLKKKVSLLFGGKETENPEELLRETLRRLARTEAKLEEFEPRLKIAEEISKISVQKVGFLRFNPFPDTGGDNSFVLALLDKDDNGVIVSSLYMREGMRIYAKKIERGRTQHPLSDEEQKILEQTIHGERKT